MISLMVSGKGDLVLKNPKQSRLKLSIPGETVYAWD
jgi:hypothetical protein